MKKLLVVHDTVSGSTAEMAAILRDALQDAFEVESVPIASAPPLAAYDAVVVGSPMRFGG